MKFNKKFLSIFFIAMLTVMLAACGGTTTTEAPTTEAPTTTAEPYDFTAAVTALKTQYADTLDSDTFLATTDLTLVDEISDVDVTWSSSNTDYIGNDGTVTRPSFTAGQQTVILTATLTVGSESEEVSFFVSVSPLDKTDQERANEVFLVVTAFPNKEKWTAADSYYVDDDGEVSGLSFLTEGKDGDNVTYTVTWTSSHPDIISVDGEINQSVEADVTVTMTASVTINSVVFTKEVDFVVAKVVDPTDVATIDAARTLYTTNNPSQDYNHFEYVKIPGVTVIGISTAGIYVTDGADIIYIYSPPASFDSLEVGDVVDVIGRIFLFFNAWELDGSDMEPLRYEVSTAAAKEAPTIVASDIYDVIDDMVTPTADTPFANTQYTVTAAVYYEDSWGNYSVFLVPTDYDFDASLQTGATQPNGDSIMMYYPANDEVLRTFHGKEVTIDIVMQGYRTDKSVWYANFFGSAEDVQLSFTDDTEAVDAVLDSLEFPYSIIENETLSLVAGLYGATVSYTSTDNAIVDPTTGIVTVTGLTEQTSVTLTASATRGDVTKTKDFVIKVGPLPMSDVVDVYTTLDGDLIKFTGVITTDTKPYQYFLQDNTAGIALDVYDWQDEFEAIAMGSEIIITGQLDISNGLYEITVLDYEVQTTTPALPTPADINSVDFTDEALLAYQGQVVAFAGFVLKDVPEADDHGTYEFVLMDILTEEEILVRIDNRSSGYSAAKTELLTLEPGDEVVITGAVLGWYYGYQLLITDANQFEVGTNGLTDQQKLDLDVENDLPASIVLEENVEIPVGIYGTTYTILKVVGNIENYLDFTTTSGSILVTLPTGLDVTGYFEIEVENGSVTEVVTMDVTISNTPLATVTDLFFSEYGEGSSYTKWLEIYNGTGADVDLSNYTLELYSNGSTVVTATLALTGTLADGEIYIVAHSDSAQAVLDVADYTTKAYPSVPNFNGDDAVVLRKNGVLIDTILNIGHTADDKIAESLTWIRKSTVIGGNTVFDIDEWDVEAIDYFDDLNQHTIIDTEITDALKILVAKASLDFGGEILSATEITLPATGSYGSTITWTIKTDAGSNATLTGNVLTLDAVEADAVVVIEATLTLGDTTPVTEKSVFTYYLTGSTAVERVAADKADLIAEELDQDLYVAADVDLPTMGSFGSTITWDITTDVDSMATLDEAGDTVSFLNATLAETTVTLTATIEYGLESDTVTVVFTLKAYPIVDLGDFTSQTEGDVVVVTGFVYAVIDGGFFIEDATGKLFVYNSTEYNVGDEVFLTGEVDVYNGLYQLSYLLEAPAALTTGNVVTQTPIEYVHDTTVLEAGETYTVRGTVAIEGEHNNVFIYLNDTDKFEIYYKSPAASIEALEALVGKEIFVDLIYYDGGDRFVYVGGTEGYSEIISDFSVLHAMTDGTNYDIPNGTEVYIKGVVIRNEYSGLFVQDINGVGIFLYYPDRTGVEIGDEVVYFGALGAFRSARQLTSGPDLIEISSSDNTIIVTPITADDLVAITGADAGTLFSFENFIYKGTSGNDMSFEYTLSDGITSKTLVIKYYTNWEDLEYLANIFSVDDALPKVEFLLYNIDTEVPVFQGFKVHFTEAQSIEASSLELPTTLELSADYIIPDPILGTQYEITSVSTELAAFIDETTTPGTLLVTRPAIGQPDAVGTISIEVSKGTATSEIIVIDVTVKAEQPVGTITELFISEYGEGSSSNKWIEIYNGTGSDVDLSIYSVALYSNGSDTATSTATLSGTLAAGDVYVIYNASAVTTIKDLGDLSSGVANFNGDDAIALLKNDAVIDVLGIIGQNGADDAGGDWADLTNHTVVRKSTITGPVTTWDPTEWDVYASDTFTYIGSHTTA